LLVALPLRAFGLRLLCALSSLLLSGVAARVRGCARVPARACCVVVVAVAAAVVVHGAWSVNV
jgi:hypothetical protein